MKKQLLTGKYVFMRRYQLKIPPSTVAAHYRKNSTCSPGTLGKLFQMCGQNKIKENFRRITYLKKLRELE